MGKWKSVETAPKDGTKFLAISSHVSDPFIASWWTSYQGISGFGVRDEYFIDGVTHWMPLPAPPPR